MLFGCDEGRVVWVFGIDIWKQNCQCFEGWDFEIVGCVEIGGFVGDFQDFELVGIIFEFCVGLCFDGVGYFFGLGVWCVDVLIKLDKKNQDEDCLVMFFYCVILKCWGMCVGWVVLYFMVG